MTDDTGEEPGATDPFGDGCAWIEGDYLPIADARIPILDTGFVRSDLTYDVVAVWEGRFFRLDDHLRRLERGARRIRMSLPLELEEIREILTEAVRRSGLRNAYVEAVVTRGVPPRGERDPRLFEPRFYAFAIPYVWIMRPEVQEVGAEVVVAREVQRIPASSVDPTVKNFHWGDLVRSLFEAYDRGASYALLTDGAGLITEGAGFNVFALVDGRLRTPGSGVLEGITRMTVIEIAQAMPIEVLVGDLPAPVLYRAKEIFLTSTAGGVMPVAKLDGEPVGDGRPGPITAAVRDRYWELHSHPDYSFAVDYPAKTGDTSWTDQKRWRSR